MADFQLKRTVWLHNKPWRPGSEDALQARGFTREQKAEQERRGAIAMLSQPKEEAPKTLADHTVKELTEIAKAEGVTGYSSMKKDELVEAIETARADAGGNDSGEPAADDSGEGESSEDGDSSENDE